MQVFIRFLILFFLGMMIQNCASSAFFEYDYGTSWKKKNELTRFGDIKEDKFIIGINIYSDFVDITELTHLNAPLLVKDSLNKVQFLNYEPSFSDGTILEKKTRYNSHFKTYDDYYTCENFSRLVKKNSHLILKIEYRIDSLGLITQHRKVYKLVKKKYYRFAVH